jgi:hypothetical protein
MAGRASIGSISEAEYASLLGALSATTKGRFFLAEYSRRSRPDEMGGLLEALHRIEANIATVRDQLQPERLADELTRVAMTLEIAAEGAEADPDGDEAARRMALVLHARRELEMLAGGLAGAPAPALADIEAAQPALDAIEDDLLFLDELSGALPEPGSAPER